VAAAVISGGSILEAQTAELAHFFAQNRLSGQNMQGTGAIPCTICKKLTPKLR
jgi:hypothetical protein